MACVPSVEGQRCEGQLCLSGNFTSADWSAVPAEGNVWFEFYSFLLIFGWQRPHPNEFNRLVSHLSALITNELEFTINLKAPLLWTFCLDPLLDLLTLRTVAVFGCKLSSYT